MSAFSQLVFRFVSSFLLATSIGVTLVLMVVGYELALWMMHAGYAQGQVSMLLLAAMPSLCALLSAPFWLTLQRMNTAGSEPGAN